MKMKQVRSWALVLLIVLSAAAVCLAQSDTARLQGTVTDPQGNAVSGATVNMTSARRALVYDYDERVGIYNGVGTSAGELPCRRCSKGIQEDFADVGTAGGAVGRGGFFSWSRRSNGTITVEADPREINLQDSALGTVIEAKQIEELPLNGRNFTSLLRYTGGHLGVVAMPTGSRATRKHTGTARGRRIASRQWNPLPSEHFILDGNDNNDSTVTHHSAFPPADRDPMNSRYQTNIARASTAGRACAGESNRLSTKGSNDYLQRFGSTANKALNAEDFFTSPHTAHSEFRAQPVGCTAADPDRKEKTLFWCTSMCAAKRTQADPPTLRVPTDAMRGYFGTAAPGRSGLLRHCLNPAMTRDWTCRRRGASFIISHDGWLGGQNGAESQWRVAIPWAPATQPNVYPSKTA